MSRTGTENPVVHDQAACVEQAVSSAVALCGRQGLNLTPVRRRVLEIVWRSHGPIGAYQILAELSKERDELKSKVEDLAAFDARQLGVAPVKVAHAQLARKSAAFKTPEEMLTAYEAMPEGAEKRSFRKMNREALFAAFSVRK